MPSYELPAHKTVSTMKTSSSKGGGGFNEIRFEEKAESEQIFIHAEKDWDQIIKHDAMVNVGNDCHQIVKNDDYTHVENDCHEKVDGNHFQQIGSDSHIEIEGQEAKKIGKQLSLTVTGDVVEVFQKNHSEKTSKDYYLNAKGSAYDYGYCPARMPNGHNRLRDLLFLVA